MSLPRYPEYKESGVSWIGRVPEHWDVAALKRMLEIQNGADHKEVEQSDGFPVIGSGGQFAYASDYLYDGESVLLGRKGTIDKPLYVNGKFWTVDTMYWSKVQPRANGRFAYYAALTIPFDYYSTNTALPSMTKGALSAHLIAQPPIAEQTAIAAFLDRETAKIDGLIAEQEKLIALLAEKRQATISHAVNRGLNPDAPMKDSGVAWLGEVPEHWQVKRMKHLVREGIAGPYGSSLTKSMYVASGYRVYGQQQVIPNDFSVGDYYISEDKFAEMRRYCVMPGDVLISVMGTIGRAAVIPLDVEPGIINPRLVLYRVVEQLVLPRYLQTFLNNPTSQRYFSLAAQGTTMEGLNMSSIGELYVALPPMDEQQEILRFIQTEGAKLEELSAEVERAEVLLKERRSALIAAAVTGQIDVRSAVAG